LFFQRPIEASCIVVVQYLVPASDAAAAELDRAGSIPYVLSGLSSEL
jgi:hypothetical protein